MRFLSADVGGTFTDLVLVDTGNGQVHLDKIPSSGHGSADAISSGIRRITEAAGTEPNAIDLFVHGFTISTNAFLTRKGARVVLVVTNGFCDVLEVADQMRPHLYALTQSKPAAVVPRDQVVEVTERLDAFGDVVVSLDSSECERVARSVAELEPQAVAVCLTFSYLNGEHELAVATAIKKQLPDIAVYCSVDVNPQIEEYPRTNTTAIAAYVGPVVSDYLSTLESALDKIDLRAPLRVMRSDGGVATPNSARLNPAHTLLSGPAGGVIAGVELARTLELDNLITFDMGGTSADFSLISDGEPRRVTGRDIDAQPLRLPSLDIETISSGGGSIAKVDLGGGLRVGPDSAGAIPGPACYGTGGIQATVTDAAVVLGILAAEDFLAGDMAIDADLAHEAISREVATPLNLSVEDAAHGVITVANTQMIQAIRTLSVERGFDVRRFALLAFGGAGPLYASFLARELGMAEIVVPRNPGVFAAYGLLMCDIRHTVQTTYTQSIDEIDAAELSTVVARLRHQLDRALADDGVSLEERYFRLGGDLRCIGQFHELQMQLPDPEGDNWWNAAEISAAFHNTHETVYGHADASSPVELVNLRLEGFGRVPKPQASLAEREGQGEAVASGSRRVYLGKELGHRDCPVFRRENLRRGEHLAGPAIITQRDATVLLLEDQQAEVANGGVLRITSRGAT